MDLVEYLIEAVKKLLKNNEDLYSEEIGAVTIIQKLTDLHVNKKNLNLLDSEKKLKKLKASSLPRGAAYYFDLMSWVEKRLNAHTKEMV
jgi:hypothetical protein